MEIVAAIIVAAFVVVWLLGSETRRKAREARDGDLVLRGIEVGLSAAPPPTPPPTRAQLKAAYIAEVMAHKAETPDLDRRATYWRTPPVEVATDAEIAAALAKGVPAVRIVFTGWTDGEKTILVRMAEGVGFRVLANGSRYLNLLCVGEEPGPVKLMKAREVGAAVISGAQFERVVSFDPAFRLSESQQPS